MSKGWYGVIEGSDGSGKGTQLELAKSYVEKALDLEPVRTFEPGGTQIGNMLREIIKDASILRDPRSNVDMLSIARREGANQVIRPAVESGRIVLADRCWFSTMAYQGFGEGVPIEYIVEKSKEALGDLLIPDLAVVLSVPYEVVEERMRKRGGSESDFFESKGTEFFKRVLAGYEWICENYPVVVIDGSVSEDEVHQSIEKYINDTNERSGGQNVS